MPIEDAPLVWDPVAHGLVVPGRWIHGDALARWWAARDRFFAALPNDKTRQALDRRRSARECYMAREERKSGTIKRLVVDKGFGFIATSDGTEYFCHRSAYAKPGTAWSRANRLTSPSCRRTKDRALKRSNRVARRSKFLGQFRRSSTASASRRGGSQALRRAVLVAEGARDSRSGAVSRNFRSRSSTLTGCWW